MRPSFSTVVIDTCLFCHSVFCFLVFLLQFNNCMFSFGHLHQKYIFSKFSNWNRFIHAFSVCLVYGWLANLDQAFFQKLFVVSYLGFWGQNYHKDFFCPRILGVEIQCIGHFKLLFSLLRCEGCAKVQEFALEVSSFFTLRKLATLPLELTQTLFWCRNLGGLNPTIYYICIKYDSDTMLILISNVQEYTVPKSIILIGLKCLWPKYLCKHVV